MFCPQCGTESSAGQPYCRSCGANLKVIGKAVALSEAVARTDRGPLPHLKEMVKKLKSEGVSEEVSRAFEQVNTEISRHATEARERHTKRWRRRQKTAAQRRERLRIRGTVSIFSGAGLSLFLYFISHSINWHLPPVDIGQGLIDIDPLVRIIWLIGLIPIFTGFGRLLASLAIKDDEPSQFEEQTVNTPEPPALKSEPESRLYEAPVSVTERTTNILEHVNRRQ
jgi:hypothetical protein